MQLHLQFPTRAGLALLALLATIGVRADESAQVATQVTVVRSAAWSQGDAVREGAAEFMVLLDIARLRQNPGPGALIGVGDRRGLFSAGVEDALHEAVLRGIPVVKLAPNGHVLAAPHGLFLDGGNLSEDEARQVLARCLVRYGALPAVGNEVATAAPRLAELRAQLQRFQHDLTLAASTRVAVR